MKCMMGGKVAIAVIEQDGDVNLQKVYDLDDPCDVSRLNAHMENMRERGWKIEKTARNSTGEILYYKDPGYINAVGLSKYI